MENNKGLKSFLIRMLFNSKMASSGLISNVLRTSLTVLGITIGVASVVSLMGIGEGARIAVVEQFESLGQNVIVLKANSGVYSFQADEYKEIMERVDAIKSATPVTNSKEYVRWRRTRGDIEVLGVNSQYPEIKDHQLQAGNFFTTLHVDTRSPVCVLGYNVAVSLLNGRSPVGYTITIDDLNFTIVGVLKKKGDGKAENIDNKIVVPYTTAMRLNDIRTVDEIWGKALDEKDTSLAIVQLSRIYSRKIQGTPVNTTNPDDGGEMPPEEMKIPDMPMPEPPLETPPNDIFTSGEDVITITSLNQLVDEANDANRIMTLLLGGIAAVSLLVGGLGIMNIMLVAVSERTGEIGVRRALGAKKTDLLFQFMLEAFYVSIIGCILGVFVGIWLINIFKSNGFAAVISIEAVRIATVVALTSGLLFGVYPAYMASNLSPVEALRRQ
ncbi:MAG: Cell division protein FtsX [Clostridiales bacterium 38_11]|nr:MAG: Cell division protein FtsX [Clostridiales bacterium 38_11]HBH12048.1 cell division protein FtsX [Clostridiales bacterium]